jgi:hypothetical protein
MAKQTFTPYSASDFVRLVLAEFPELREEFGYEGNLLHLQMHDFTALMRRAIAAGDWATYKRGVHVTTELWSRANNALLNALNVSFLEHLDFGGENGPTAWKLLTTDLRRGWSAMDAYNAKTAEQVALPRKQPRKKSR